jgi:hypothetical protein
MHPGSLFLGFSLLVFSCLSNSMCSLSANWLEDSH